MSHEPRSHVRVECIVPGGDGLARLADGRPVFITGALPGDLVQLQELEELSRYARAKAWQLAEPSADRRTAPCSVAASCGGCDLMSLSEAAQRRSKLGVLSQALARTGGIHQLPNELELVRAGPALGYRSRVRVHLLDGEIGFFARATRQLVVFPECLVCSPELNVALAAFRARLSATPAAYACFGEAEIRAFAPEHLGRAALPSLCLYVTDGVRELSLAAEAQVKALRADFHVSVVERQRGRERVLIASEQLTEVQLDLHGSLELSAGAFSQVNWAVNQRLVSDLVQGARERGLSSFLDLYCGAGNFSLPLLRVGLSGVGVEASAVSLENARRMSQKQKLAGGRFIHAPVEVALKRLLKQKSRFELALLDPPRAGAKRALADLCALQPKVIFMCSCDPVTFARDLKALLASGYILDQVRAYDMFPQTHHLESTAWLSRAP